MIEFKAKLTDAELEAFLDSLPEISEMDADTLREYRDKVQEFIDRLDAVEPRNMNSEAYDLWAEKHEDLEDVLDEILDCIEEL